MLVLLAFSIYQFSFNLANFNWVLIASFLAFFSFYGDRREIAFQIRLVVQCSCSTLILGLAFLQNQLPIFIDTTFFWLVIIIFVVGSANFFNFMDGIDGLAITTALAAFACLAFYAQQQGLIEWVLFFIVAFFACLGFLPWNISFFARAKVFMGDVGSIFLGFTIAFSIFFIAQSWFDFFKLCSALLIFYADCLLTLLAKLNRKIKLSSPHRLHLYQILANENKTAHWKIVFFYTLAQFSCTMYILLFTNSWLELFLNMFFISAIMFFIYIVIRKRIINCFF